MATFPDIIMFLRHKQVPRPFDSAISSFWYLIFNNILVNCERPEELAILISRLLLRICGIYLSSRLFWTFTQNYARLELRSLFHSFWGCGGDRLEIVVKVHCGTVLGVAFSTWRQICPPKQSHNALSQPSRPGLPRNLKVANTAFTNSNPMSFLDMHMRPRTVLIEG